MTNWQFCTIGVLGIGIVVMFAWFVFGRKEKFDAPLLGLLTLGMLFILVWLMQPGSIEYGGVKFSDIKRETQDINSKAKESVKLALETAAMLTWNAGRYDVAGRHNEEIATSLLKELYGDKALEYRYALQKKGIYVTLPEELRKIPETEVPKEIQSPFYENYLKNLRLSHS